MKITSLEADRCTGCLACRSVCPATAITVAHDEYGFAHPTVDTSLCTDCGICAKVCPSMTPDNAKPTVHRAYAGWVRDKHQLKVSTSGGAFAALAMTVLDMGGIVYGAGFADQYTVVHMRAENRDELSKLYGAKYVQSDTDGVYDKVRHDLECGKTVLFSGTPCQIAGLHAAVGKNERLITCDLVCHGVPSPEIYREYIRHMEKKYGAEAKQVRFRDKKKSWKCFNMRIDFRGGAVYTANCYDDMYHVGFLKNLFLRPSCNTCPYTSMNRVSDITLSDFWGYFRRGADPVDNDRGISLILVNTGAGGRLVAGAGKYLKLCEKDYPLVQKTQPCLNKPFSASPDADEFRRDFREGGFDRVADKYMRPKTDVNPFYADLYYHSYPVAQLRRIARHFFRRG